MFWPVDGSPGVYLSVHSGVKVDASEGYLAPPPILLWMELQDMRLETRYIQGKQNGITDQFRVVLLSWVFDNFSKVFRRLMVDLSVTPQPQTPGLCVSSSHISWDHLEAFVFPPFTVIRSVQNNVIVSDCLSLVLVAPLASQGVVSRPFISAGGGTPRAS